MICEHKCLDNHIETICHTLFNDEEILLAFLNAALECPKEQQIVTIVEKFCSFPIQSNVWNWRFGTASKELITVNMQIRTPEFYHKRSLYYRSSMDQCQIAEHSKRYNTQKVVQINLLTFNLLQESTDFHTKYSLYHDQNRQSRHDVHYLELMKIPNTSIDNALYYWLRFILCVSLNEKSKEYRELINYDPLFQRAALSLEI